MAGKVEHLQYNNNVNKTVWWVDEWMDGWMGGWVDGWVESRSKDCYSNKNSALHNNLCRK